MLSRHTRLLVGGLCLSLAACSDSTTNPDTPNPTPGISFIEPDSLIERTAGTLTIHGSDFVPSSVVRIEDADQPTQYRSGAEIQVDVGAEVFPLPGSYRVTVRNPAPGGGTSNPASVRVVAATAPVPILTSLDPAELAAGSAATTVAVLGEGFLPRSQVFVEGWREVRYRSQTRLEVTLPAELLSEPARLRVVVRNAPPGGGDSRMDTLTVLAPTPQIARLGQDEVEAGQPTAPIRVLGSGFLDTSEVLIGGAPRPTRRIAENELEADLAPEDLKGPGTLVVAVRSPAPGGGISNTLLLSVIAPVPELHALATQGATAGRPGFSLWVHGAKFTDASVVRWNGQPRPTQYRSATRLVANLSASDVSSPRTADVSVHTPAPDGGTSAALPFRVRALGAASLTTQLRVPLRARAVAYDSISNRLFVSVRADDARYGNSVVRVDPRTGMVTGSIFVGSEPSSMDVSDDGEYLYVALDGASAVRTVHLPSFQPGLQWALPAGQVARELEVVAGQSRTVALSRHRPGISPSFDGVTIYDEGVARPVSSGGHTGASRLESMPGGPADRLYGYNNLHTGFGFYVLGITADGVRNISSTGGLLRGFGTQMEAAGGRIYGTGGEIIDPEILERIGTIPAAGPVAPAPELGRVFFLYGGQILVHDANTFQHLGAVDLPYAYGSVGFLIRWGEDGLAFVDEEWLVILRSPVFGP